MVVGRNPNTGTILSTVDIVAHEYGHGVTNHLVAGWERTNSEPGSLNEGFSDIIASAMERELLPDGGPNGEWYWQVGENAWFIRNMARPNDFLQPQTYHQAGFWNFNPDQPAPNGGREGPHHNNGVLNKWFHTLCTGQGPNGINITPISVNDAMSIVYWALDYTIHGSYGYQSAAQALRSAARQVFGDCSPQQNAVIAALRAVNLQAEDCSPDCNYQAVNMSPSTANCNQGITLSAGCTGGPGNTNG